MGSAEPAGLCSPALVMLERPGGATMAQREASEVVVRYATTVWACE